MRDLRRADPPRERAVIAAPWIGVTVVAIGASPQGGEPEAEVDVNGRVILQSLTTADPTHTDVSLESARLGVEYRRGGSPRNEKGGAPAWLEVVVEADLAGRPDVRDAFVRLRRWGFGARAGQFKAPSSAIEMASDWTLPLARDGLLHDVLLRRMQIGGRRPGFEIEWAPDVRLRPRVRAGVFQGSRPDGDLLERADGASQNAAGRASLGWGPVEVGAFAESRASEPVLGAGAERFFAAGGDVTMRKKWKRWGVRAWADAFRGSHWFDFDVFDDREPRFTAGRGVAAVRRGGMQREKPYVEVFAMGGALDPDGAITSDLIGEAAGGVNLGFWRVARLTLAYEARRVSRNTPPLLGRLGADLLDEDAFVAQIGGAF